MLIRVPELARRLNVAESRARFLVASGRIRGLRVVLACVTPQGLFRTRSGVSEFHESSGPGFLEDT